MSTGLNTYDISISLSKIRKAEIKIVNQDGRFCLPAIFHSPESVKESIWDASDYQVSAAATDFPEDELMKFSAHLQISTDQPQILITINAEQNDHGSGEVTVYAHESQDIVMIKNGHMTVTEMLGLI